MRVIYHPLAETELVEAAQFYNGRVEGLGKKLLDELEETVEKIANDPLRSLVVKNNIRLCLMRQFPFGVYYRVSENEVRSLVIKHHHRHPDFGADRS